VALGVRDANDPSDPAARIEAWRMVHAEPDPNRVALEAHRVHSPFVLRYRETLKEAKWRCEVSPTENPS